MSVDPSRARAFCSSSAAASPPSSRWSWPAGCASAARRADRDDAGGGALRHAAVGGGAERAPVRDDLFSLTTRPRWAISNFRARPTSSWSRRRPPIFWPRWPMASPTISPTTLLATDKRVLVAPAMNVRMWLHPATQRNVGRLRADGDRSSAPRTGNGLRRIRAGAHGGAGGDRRRDRGRCRWNGLAESPESLAATWPLSGRHVLVTAGPTYEAIDPVRFIGNRSSGLQGYAIARAARRRREGDAGQRAGRPG